MRYQLIANPVQSGASVPVTFVPGPRAPKTERVPCSSATGCPENKAPRSMDW